MADEAGGSGDEYGFGLEVDVVVQHGLAVGVERGFRICARRCG